MSMEFNLLAYNTEDTPMPTVYGFGTGFTSAFGKVRFNLSTYNISNGIGWLSVDGLETIKANAVTGSVTMISGEAYEKIDAEATGSIGQFVSAYGAETVEASPVYAITFIKGPSGEEIISADADGHIVQFFYLSGAEKVSAEGRIIGITYLSLTGAETIDVSPVYVVTFIRGVTGTEVISASAVTGKIVMLYLSGAETVSASAVIGQDLKLRLSGAEIVQSSARITQNVKLSAEGFELIGATASVASFEEKICILTVTLRPGQRLIVDANTYNIWLNGENAIYIHSGDWIDSLNRDTSELTIMAASGGANLSARLVYQELYL